MMQQKEQFEHYLDMLGTSLEILDDKPEETVETTLKALWHLASGNALSVERAVNSELTPLTESQFFKLDDYIAERSSGTPLAHITKRQNFMGLELIAGTEALVPRKETELLGNAALAKLQEMTKHKEHALVLDVCTGSGNLAFALASNCPSSKVFAADLSEKAIALSNRNNEYLKLPNPVVFECGDLLAPFDNTQFHGNVDLLTCNPPYISTGKLESLANEIIDFEPDMAFDGGPFGVKIVQRIIKEALVYLKVGGWLAFEVGLGQGESLLKRLEKNSAYCEATAVNDNSGSVRAILVKKS